MLSWIKVNKIISEFNVKQKEFMFKISNLESDIKKLNTKKHPN